MFLGIRCGATCAREMPPPRVLLLKLLEALHLGWHQTTVLLLAGIKRRRPNAGLAAHLLNRCAFLCLGSTYAICASVNFDHRIAILLISRRQYKQRILAVNGPVFWEQVMSVVDSKLQLALFCTGFVASSLSESSAYGSQQ